MRNAILVAKNTLRVTFRKKSSLIVFFLVPLMAVLFSFWVYGNPTAGSLTVGVCDLDRSQISGDMIQGLKGKFKILVVEQGALNERITAGTLDCGVLIPQGFADDISRGNLKQLQLVSLKGEASTAFITNYLNIYCRNLQDIGQAALGRKHVFDKIYGRFIGEKLALKVNWVADASGSKDMTAQSIGFLIMFILVGASNTAEIILKEKRNRTYERIRCAPVKGGTYIWGNVLANLVVVAAQILLTLLFLVGVLRVQTYIPFYQLFFVLVLFGLVAIGFGLTVVSFAQDSTQANTLQLLFITPTCMLAGCFFPLEIMPETARRIADFLPQRWAISAIQQLQDGQSFSHILINLCIIAAFALAFFLIAGYKFSRKESGGTFV